MDKCCIYCLEWMSSRILKRADNGGEESSSKKKRKKNRKLSSVVRDCEITGKEIKRDSPSCRYFKPANTFFCVGADHRITLLTCLHKRRLYKKTKGKKPFNPECRSCRQFDREIYPIANQFELYKLLTPLRIIKRRPQKRKIKRRALPEETKPKRVIKRREKKRTIKRR